MALSDKQRRLVDRAIKVLRDDATASGTVFTSVESSMEYMQLKVGGYEREQFAVLFLDSQHNLIADEIMFSGTIDAAAVYPREIVKRALQLNAAAIILGHNHPSGVCEPSNADERITQRIQQALELVDIRVLDHIVVGKGCYSFAQRGIL